MHRLPMHACMRPSLRASTAAPWAARRGCQTAPAATTPFQLDALPPHLQEEFDVDANRRALRHLLRSRSASRPGADLVIAPSSVHAVVWRCTRCRTQWSARPADRTHAQTADAHRCPTCYSSEAAPAASAGSRDAGVGVHAAAAASAQPGPSSAGALAGRSGSSLLCDVYPLLAAQWDEHRNGLLQNRVLQSATEVHTSSSAKVWWRCPLCCTPWLEAVSSRVARHAVLTQLQQQQHKKSAQRSTQLDKGAGSDAVVPLCPSCERRGAAAARGGTGVRPPRRWLADDALLLGEALLRPDHNPREIALTSEMMLQWRCSSCQFEYAATVANRFLRHERCPQCSGRTKTMMNLLVVQRPDVVQEVSKHISRTRLRHVTVHDDVELPFVCRNCFSPYCMTARARCAVPRGVPACSKCFLTHTQVLTEAQQQQQQRHGGVAALSARARRRVRQKALKLSRSSRHADHLAATASELSHRDAAIKD